MKRCEHCGQPLPQVTVDGQPSGQRFCDRRCLDQHARLPRAERVKMLERRLIAKGQVLGTT